MKNHIRRSSLIALLVISANLAGFAQKGKPAIDERNVRAGMYFLAGDAMQGRGSGTAFERIAAEYVGSQFMQFGLEGAGDAMFDGKPGYVQSVAISRNAFSGPPVLTFGTRTLEHGKDMIVIRANSARLSGDLNKISLTDKSRAGAAAFVRMGDMGTGQNLTQTLQTVTSGDAPIVIVEETAQTRSVWASAAARRITWTTTGAAAKPLAIVVVSKQAAAEIAGLSEGSRIEFSGTLAPVQSQQTWNAVGKITGTDKTLSTEVILLSSHLDHLGVRENDPGPDKIFNGADDDASGTVAVLELARALGGGKRPKRTVYFVCFGSEESGGLGSRYFVESLPFPKEKLVANLQFEMIGRPDAKVKPDELWLTGYERSDLGPELAKRGAKLVQDPHPDQNFFFRSDNITLARQGVVAHTVSSFGLHTDYHRASDEIKTIDFTHMTRAINSMAAPVEWLVNSNFRPVWAEGKRP